jgi:hypothetical protein
MFHRSMGPTTSHCFQLQQAVEHRQNMYTDSKHPPHDVPEVSGCLAVQFSAKPRLVLADPLCELLDGFAS